MGLLECYNQTESNISIQKQRELSSRIVANFREDEDPFYYFFVPLELEKAVMFDPFMGNLLERGSIAKNNRHGRSRHYCF